MTNVPLKFVLAVAVTTEVENSPLVKGYKQFLHVFFIFIAE